MTEMVRIDRIRQDKELQNRCEMQHFLIEDYLAVLVGGGSLPDVTIFRDKRGVNWLPDGNHRMAAHERAGRTHINADVRPGEKRDAILFACSVNEEHGLRRTVKDRQRAVYRLLDDPEWRELSERKMAEICKVSVGFVHGQKEKWETERGTPLPTRNPNMDRHKEKPEPDPDPAPPMPTLTLHAPCNEEEPSLGLQEEFVPHEDADVIKDSVGQAVPARLAHLFGDVPRFKVAINAINLARRELVEVMEKHPSTATYKTSIQSDLDNAKSAIRTVLPFAVCPVCKGEGCKKRESPCRTLGYVVEDSWNVYQKNHSAAA